MENANEQSKNHIVHRDSSRRDFLKKAAAVSAAALTASSALPFSGCCISSQVMPRQEPQEFIQRNNTILFQGDSITDAGRNRNRGKIANDARAMGTGYASIAASQLLAERFDYGLNIYNRGISGNKVFQLAERWEQDCIALKPNVLSILIGVNDLWHRLRGRYDGTLEVYERDYRELLERTYRLLPDVKFVICEPFVLRCGEVNEKWFPEFNRFRDVAKDIAIAFNAVFVPFQKMFDKAVETAPPDYWAVDGVHPTMAGCHLMAKTWVKAVS